MSAGTVAGTAVVAIASETADFAGAGRYSLANMDDADTIYVDFNNTSVTSSTGFPVAAGFGYDFKLAPGDVLHGCCASGGTAAYRLIRQEA